MKLFLPTVILVSLAATTQAALEREDENVDRRLKPDFDELRLEEHLGDDVAVDPYSHETLVRIARQMGVVVTTEPSVHTAKALPKPQLEPSTDWEPTSSQSTPAEESRKPPKLLERLELDRARKLNFAASEAVAAAAAAAATTPVIDKRIGELLPEDYRNEEKSVGASTHLDSTGSRRIGKLRTADFPKAEFRADSQNVSHDASHLDAERRSESDPLRARDWSITSGSVHSKKTSQSGKPNRKTHAADKKGNDKHHKTKFASTSTATTTTTTTTTSAPSTTQKSPSSYSAVGSSSIDKHGNSGGSLIEGQPETADNSDPADDELLIDAKTKKILQQLAAFNLYQQLQMPLEVEADEDSGRLPLTDEDSSSEQDLTPIGNDGGSSEGSKVSSTAEPSVSSSEDETTDNDRRNSIQQKQKPEVKSNKNSWRSSSRKNKKRPSYSVDDEPETDNWDRPISQFVYHREVNRKPPKSKPPPLILVAQSMVLREDKYPPRSSANIHSASFAEVATGAPLRSPSSKPASSSTTTSTSSTTTMKPLTESLSSLEDFDSDLQPGDDESFSATTTETTTTTTTLAPTFSEESTSKRKMRKPANGKEVAKSDASTQNSTFVTSATYQTPQIVLPPPTQLNPLAALGNLIPLLQLLNRHSPAAFYAVPPTTSPVKDSIKKPAVVKPQILPQRYPLPYYPVPAQYLVNSAPYYGLQQIQQIQPTRVNATSTPQQESTASRIASKSKPKETQMLKVPSDSQTKSKTKKPPAHNQPSAPAQVPNISKTIRSMLHFLNSNNLIAASAQAPKRPRTPKGLDSSPDSSNSSVQPLMENNQQPDADLKLETGDSFNYRQTRLSDTNEQSTSDESPAARDNNDNINDRDINNNNNNDNNINDRDNINDNNNDNDDESLVEIKDRLPAVRVSNDSEVATDETEQVSAVASEEKPFDETFGLSKEDVKEQASQMERRMDLGAFSNDSNADNEEVLGRALVGGANYKMLMGLLTGAFAKRRDARSSDSDVDLEKKQRQIANDLIMQSILYNPPPMYHRAPPDAVWPVLSGPQTFVKPVHRVPPIEAGRPAFYSKQFVVRPRQPRYFVIDDGGGGGFQGGVSQDSLPDEQGRSIRGENEFFHKMFPTIPIERRPAHTARLASSVEELPLPGKGVAGKPTLQVDNMHSLPTNSSTRRMTTTTTTTATSSAFWPPAPQPSSTSSMPSEPEPESERSTVPSISELETGSRSSVAAISSTIPAFRIVVPPLTSTAPPPVIRFSNRIGDRKVKRSAGPAAFTSGEETRRRSPLRTDLNSFFRLAGEVRENSSDPLIPRRISTSPKQAFLHADDLGTLSVKPSDLKTTFSRSESHPADQRKQNRRSADANYNNYDDYYRDYSESLTAAAGAVRSTSGSSASTVAAAATAAFSYDKIERCFAPNASFSQKLNCNDQQFSCETPNVDDGSVFVRCSCEDNCVHFGDCCWDKISQLQKEHGSLSAIEYSRDRLTWLHCVRTEPDSAYFMVARCPRPADHEHEHDHEQDNDSDRKRDINALCSGDSGTDSLLQVPVTSRKTLVTYKNVFCAECHDDADDVKFWRVQLVCPNGRNIERVDRALAECPFITMPPKSLSPYSVEFRVRGQFARRCNPYIDYGESAKLDCHVISANSTSTIEAPNADVADKLSIMCDLIYLPTLDLNASGCDKLFYRNRFCALCKRRLPADLSCPLEAEMPNADDPRLSLNDVTEFPFEIPSGACDDDSHIFDPWKSVCRRLRRLRRTSTDSKSQCVARSETSAFQHLEARFPFVQMSLGFLMATLLLSLLIPSSLSRTRIPCKTYIGEITICLVSAVLGSQFLLHVSLTSSVCFAQILCFLMGFGFHFCTAASFAWSNILLCEVRNRLQGVPLHREKNTFVGYLLYTLVFSCLSVGGALLARWKFSGFPVYDCANCGSLCFLLSSTTYSGWLSLGPAVVFTIVSNFCKFLSILRLWKSQTDETMFRIVSRLEFRNVVFAVLLANLVAPTVLLALVADRLDNQRFWLSFLLCYAFHGPFIFFGATFGRFFRLLKKHPEKTYRTSANLTHTNYHGIYSSRA